MLRDPGRHLEAAAASASSSSFGESQASALVTERVEELVAAAQRVQRALALLEGRGGPGQGGQGIAEMAAALTLDDRQQQNGALALLPPPIVLVSPAGGGGGGNTTPASPFAAQSPPQQPRPAPQQLKVIPRRLLGGMESLRAQGHKLAGVRDAFVERASRHVAALFPTFVRPEMLPGACVGGWVGGWVGMRDG